MIQVIHRALDILEYIARQEGQAVSLKEVSDHLKLNQATCANIIKTLSNRNYVEHIGPKKGFRLGVMAEFLIGNFSFRSQLLLAAKGEMDKLTQKLNESTILGIIQNDKRVVVYSSNSDHDLNVRSKTERSVYETASGRLILSYYNDEEIMKFIERNGIPPTETWNEIKTKADLIEALKKIKKAGYVLTHSAKHIVGIAVPIKKGENIAASLSIYLPASRFSKALEKTMLQELNITAEKINARIQSSQLSKAKL